MGLTVIDQRAVEAIVKHRAQQKVAELSALLAFLEGRKIDRVLEIGSYNGGTLWLWTQIAEIVVSVDILAVPTDHIERPVWALRADSHHPFTLALLEEIEFDLIFIDGDHTYEGVRQDWLDYSSLVTLGGVVVLHDIVKHRPEQACEVDRLWTELCVAGRETYEFITPVDVPIDPPIDPRSALPEQSAGIGVVVL